MRAFLLLLSLCCPAGLVSQQTLASPPYLINSEGTLHCKDFGSDPAMRYQLLDPENRGVSATLKALALRVDYRDFNATSGMGRSWSRLSIRIGDGDRKGFGALSSQNFVNAPTLVFQNAVRWPTLSGLPFAKPDVWGGLSGQLRMPFSQTWMYRGQLDILTDWEFAGGSLANGAPWQASTNADYYLDSYHDPSVTTVHARYSTLPLFRLDNSSFGVKGRCNDSAIQSKTGATMELEALLANRNHHLPSWRDRLVVRTRSLGSAPGTPVLHAFGIVSYVQGIDILTGCNRLHIGPPMVLVPYPTLPLTLDPRGASNLHTVLFPWGKDLAGLPFLCQGAWTDSKTGKLQLTQAATAILPREFSSAARPQRLASFAVGLGPAISPSSLAISNPLLSYEY